MPPASQPRPFGVLVVEDEPLILRFVTSMLRALGAAAFGAAGGPEAARLLREHAGEIDAALIDFHMPGMDGLATRELLHRIEPGLRCGLMSGMDVEGAPLPDGFRCALGKPFRTAGLRDCLDALRDAAAVSAAS